MAETTQHPWGVGMPAWLHLHDFAAECERAFGIGLVYLVGSALTTKRPRDVDIRMVVSDPVFQQTFGGMNQFGKPGTKWAACCKAFSALGKQMTNRPIDFQVQPVAVDLVYRDEPRLRLGMDKEPSDG